MNSGGDRRRSDATRAAILHAARQRFGADGYERATIRAIARDAQIDPSMVIRYYGSKEKLLDAASDLDLQLPDPRTMPPDRVGELLVTHFLYRWENDDTIAAMLRVGVTNASGAQRLEAIVAGQLREFVRRLGPAPALTTRRTHLVMTQMFGLALCRYVLRMPHLVAMPRTHVIAWLGPTIHRYLTASTP